MAEVIDGILIREVETKNIMTKSSLPVGGYSVNPYVGCTHACKYCYLPYLKLQRLFAVIHLSPPCNRVSEKVYLFGVTNRRTIGI